MKNSFQMTVYRCISANESSSGCGYQTHSF